MVGQFADHGCADDRDRVYALLSLADKDKPINVSYTKSVAAVYTEFYALYGRLGMLFEAGLCYRKLHAVDTLNNDPRDPEYMPSWVPELRSTHTSGWRPVFGGSFNTTSALRGARGWHKEAPRRLLVQALRYDVIDRIVNSPYAVGATVNTLDILEFVERLKEEMLSPERSYLSTDDELILAQVLVGGLPEYPSASVLQILQKVHSGAPGDDLKRLLYVWITFDQQFLRQDGKLRMMLTDDQQEWPMTISAYDNLDPDSKHAMHFLGCTLATLKKHDIFFTERAQIGLAPLTTAVKDECIVIQGCLEPYIARHVPGSTEYRLVGPCYLDGVMNGETYASGAIDDIDWLALI